MLRLSVLLIAGFYVTLLVAGGEKGQMRPGLARAVANGEEIVVIQRSYAAIEPVAAAAPATAPSPATTPDAEPAVQVARASTAVLTEPAPEPELAVARVMPKPVFTLSALSEPAAVVSPASPEVSEAGSEIWYVAASKVNVRQGPSTDTSVVGKLVSGEAVTVLAMEGDEWARILIEGDGIEGYVAARFLSTAP